MKLEMKVILLKTARKENKEQIKVMPLFDRKMIMTLKMNFTN